MTREHHVVAVTWRRRRMFLLWYTNEEDGLVTDDGGRLRVFSSEDQARAFAMAAALTVGDVELSCYDFDRIESWTNDPRPGIVQWDSVLDAWNLLADIAQSVGDQVAATRLLDRAISPAYDRLVNHCDLPALGTRSDLGELSEEDRRAIAGVLRHGLASFEGAI